MDTWSHRRERKAEPPGSSFLHILKSITGPDFWRQAGSCLELIGVFLSSWFCFDFWAGNPASAEHKTSIRIFRLLHQFFKVPSIKSTFPQGQVKMESNPVFFSLAQHPFAAWESHGHLNLPTSRTVSSCIPPSLRHLPGYELFRIHSVTISSEQVLYQKQELKFYTQLPKKQDTQQKSIYPNLQRMLRLKISSFPAVKPHTCCRKPESHCQQDINLKTQTVPLPFENYLEISGWTLIDYINYAGRATNENVSGKASANQNRLDYPSGANQQESMDFHGGLMICSSWSTFSLQKPLISVSVKIAGRL